jgi:hypothetical protein
MHLLSPDPECSRLPSPLEDGLLDSLAGLYIIGESARPGTGWGHLLFIFLGPWLWVGLRRWLLRLPPTTPDFPSLRLWAPAIAGSMLLLATSFAAQISPSAREHPHPLEGCHSWFFGVVGLLAGLFWVSPRWLAYGFFFIGGAGLGLPLRQVLPAGGLLMVASGMALLLRFLARRRQGSTQP